MLELGRKRFEDMRWEEIWDASLRIRALFNGTLIPSDLKTAMTNAIKPVFQERPVVVRSSAVGEDASNSSFAGIHESYVNVRGTEAIMDHIKLVWASLWSDAAMLYRKELGLTVEELLAGNDITPESKNHLGSRKEFDLDKDVIVDFCHFAIQFFDKV